MNEIVTINENKEITEIEPDDSGFAITEYDPEYDRLSLKQKEFIEHYLGDAKGIAYKAAQMAGYAGDRKTLAPLASRLLQHPTIAACVRARVREVMSEQETITQLASVIRKETSEIGLNARVKAIELMMRYHGVLVDKLEHSGTVQQQVKQIVVSYAVTQTQTEEKE